MADEKRPAWADRPWERGEDGAQTKKGTSSSMGCLWIALLVIGTSVGCTALLMSGGDSDDDAPSSAEAETQCQGWVRERLRAPSTAEFSETVTTGGPSSWESRGVVDAENGFGAMLRMTWTCEIRLDGDTWRGSVDVQE